MKSCNLMISVFGLVLTWAGPAALPAEVTVPLDAVAQVPNTAAAQNAEELLSRAKRAITRYIAACASRNAHALNSVTTNDARIEYALDDPGKYLSVDAASLIADCSASAPARNTASPLSNLWVFPTRDTNAVFVQYDTTAGSKISQRQLALVEMRGDRIARMLNFAAPPQSIVANAARLSTAELVCSSRTNAGAESVADTNQRTAMP